MSNAEVVMEVKAVSYTRDSRGKTVNKHFKDTMNTIHQSTGSGGNTDCLVAESVIIDDTFGYESENRVYSEYSPTIRSERSGLKVASASDAVQEGDIHCRIRKLTPRECFRLMGVDDADIDKIQASGISNSQQYKCAGNSIVVDVLYHLFRKMFCETACEKENFQQTLF